MPSPPSHRLLGEERQQPIDEQSWRFLGDEVSALGHDLNLRRLERYLTAAWDSGAEPVIVLTKADLHSDAAPEAVADVEAIAFGVPVHAVSNVTGEGLDALDPYLGPGRTVALLGSSGVGKSTLVNSLLG